jgi:hypothetical protein
MNAQYELVVRKIARLTLPAQISIFFGATLFATPISEFIGQVALSTLLNILASFLAASIYVVLSTNPAICLFVVLAFKSTKSWFLRKRAVLLNLSTTRALIELTRRIKNETPRTTKDNLTTRLVYRDGTSEWVFMFPNKLRSEDLIVFTNEQNVDVTYKIEPYLGPLQNFHGVCYTPADFGYKSLLMFRDGNINICRKFTEHEVIVFEPSTQL